MHPDYFAEFLALAAVHFLVVIAPGPDFFVTIRQSVRHGRRAAAATALGIATGMSVHVVYTLLGMGALMHSTPWLMQVAQLLGGLYLLYLGIGFIRQAGETAAGAGELAVTDGSGGAAASSTGNPAENPAGRSAGSSAENPVGSSAGSSAGGLAGKAASAGHEASSVTMTLRQSFLQGFLTNATNPKATLFFLAVFTTMVSAETPMSVQVLYGGWMCLVNAIWFVLVGLVFSSAPVRGRFLRASLWIERGMGVLMIAFSARLLWGSVALLASVQQVLAA